ncbi:MAG: hypothetical protein PHI90_05365 [Clostridia bacterium]|nr:hypothetical protein [Clostridia bacterium]
MPYDANGYYIPRGRKNTASNDQLGHYKKAVLALIKLSDEEYSRNSQFCDYYYSYINNNFMSWKLIIEMNNAMESRLENISLKYKEEIKTNHEYANNQIKKQQKDGKISEAEAFSASYDLKNIFKEANANINSYLSAVIYLINEKESLGLRCGLESRINDNGGMLQYFIEKCNEGTQNEIDDNFRIITGIEPPDIDSIQIDINEQKEQQNGNINKNESTIVTTINKLRSQLSKKKRNESTDLNKTNQKPERGK